MLTHHQFCNAAVAPACLPQTTVKTRFRTPDGVVRRGTLVRNYDCADGGRMTSLSFTEIGSGTVFSAGEEIVEGDLCGCGV